MIEYSNSNPPLLQDYAQLVHKLQSHVGVDQCEEEGMMMMMMVQEECELPLIDLGVLITSESSSDEASKLECMAKIAKASSEWGFFQVVNHGVSSELLRKMREEQIKLFRAPFEKKASSGLLNNSYRWGTPTATCPKQFSWSEAFHIPLAKISDQASYGDFTSLREVMVEYAEAMQGVAKLLAGVLAMKMGRPKQVLEEICDENTCFLRLNRYPACPISPEIFGLVPHTDSDFLTILHQDEVGGLQLMKDSKWVAVKPNADALIVNIGDLFQAWSNDAYKSVEHKVMVKRKVERFSIAYFLCPSYESEIGSCKREPSASVYKAFTFGQYRHQVREDVKSIGHKVGLSRFRV
ncbi:gibberellin 2-beta-dioxygenase 8-like [Coffea arabica]|uniref:gibberellin 2beta-dioxygenase n=1 Tax=Coffea arabica TaxID=13443 RepID=A0A6P6V857_COFAR|nr:gibberellin 2-beta-dioxygenase 8-like [Coffea arabica]